MSEAKFTSGPWVAFQNEVGSWEVNCRSSLDDEVGRYSPTICSTWNVTYTELENKLQEPNAHLIAAAPEMYEEIERDVNNLFELLSNLKRYSNDHLFYESELKRKQLLLAKARGEL